MTGRDNRRSGVNTVEVTAVQSEWQAATFAVECMKSDRQAGFGLYGRLSEAAYIVCLMRAMARRAEAAAALQAEDGVAV